MTLNGTDISVLLPLLLIAGASIVVMVVTAIRRNHRLAVLLTLLGLALAFASVWQILPLAPRQVGPLLIIDGYALFYIGLKGTCCAFFKREGVGKKKHKRKNPHAAVLGRLGGLVRSVAKKRADRENGRKGGLVKSRKKTLASRRNARRPRPGRRKKS